MGERIEELHLRKKGRSQEREEEEIVAKETYKILEIFQERSKEEKSRSREIGGER